MEGRRMILFLITQELECPSSELYCMELQADRFYQKRIYQHRYNEARSNYN